MIKLRLTLPNSLLTIMQMGFKTWDSWGFQVVLVVKNLPANAGDIRDMGSIPGLEDPLEEGMAKPGIPYDKPWTGSTSHNCLSKPHSSVPALRSEGNMLSVPGSVGLHSI